MKVSRCSCILILLLPIVASAIAPERTLSSSRQFILYGTDVALRGAIAGLAEETKTNLLALLRRPDAWKTPIVINLQFPQANVPETPAARMHVSQTGGGLKLQLDLKIAPDFKSAAVERELLRAILLEMIYRKHADMAAGTQYLDPPDWLLDGALALAAGRDGRVLVEALEPLVATNKLNTLSGFLREHPTLLDSPSRRVYRAYSAVLLKWLLDQAEGTAQLGRYIDNYSQASNDLLADLSIYFPGLSRNTAEKRWQLTIAKFCDAQGYHFFTFQETERKLDELLLEMAGSGRSELTLENLSQRKDLPVESKALAQLNHDLTLLGLRANPILRPIVAEYQQVVALLAKGRRPGLSQRLARVKSLRAQIVARMNKIDDYMNWFEATQARTRSGAFADYLNAAAEQNGSVPRRHDAFSVYLDSLEGQFQD